MIIENENKHLIVCTHLHIQNSQFREKIHWKNSSEQEIDKTQRKTVGSDG